MITFPQSKKCIIGLCLWLCVGLAIAGTYVAINLSGAARFGLGWAIKPGFVVLFLVIAIAALEFKTVQLPKILQVVICLLAAVYLEYLSLPRPVVFFVGIAFTLLGQTFLFNSVRSIRIPETLLLLVSSYIQAVYIYNLFCGEQMMFFFKPGWTI